VRGGKGNRGRNLHSPLHCARRVSWKPNHRRRRPISSAPPFPTTTWPDLAAMDPPQGPPTAGGAPPSPAVVDVPVEGPPNAGDMSAMISAAIPLKRKRIPKQHFDAPAAAAAPPAVTPPAVTAAADKKGGRVKTKAVRPRGAPPSRVKTKAVSRIGLALHRPPRPQSLLPPFRPRRRHPSWM
jgi:hypothetical protein